MTIAANGVDLFLPETYDIVWSLIILIIVALFFYKFFLPKFQSVFDERTAKIEGGLAKAEQAQKDAEEAKKKYQAQLSTARVEASKIRDDARAEASHIIADARSRAETEAAQITANAERSLESQQQKAMVNLKGEVGSLATSLASKILGSELQDSAVQKQEVVLRHPRALGARMSEEREVTDARRGVTLGGSRIARFLCRQAA